ncbi:hypothetical protein DK944_004351, partial [Escherichia coli]|nr:hypothetical protein [Escherichia coli]
MMNELLRSAIDALSIMHINIRESNFAFSEGYNSFNFNSINKQTQSFRKIKKIEAIELVSDDDSLKNELYYSFHYSVGLRFIAKSEETSKDENDVDTIFSIEAIFEAIYRSKRELSKEELEEFAKQNVGF